MDRGSTLRVVYVGVYFSIIFVSFVSSIRSILQPVSLLVTAGNFFFFISVNTLMFGAIYWQYPRLVSEKIEKTVYHLEFTKQIDREPDLDSKSKKKKKKKKKNKRRRGKAPAPNPKDLVLTDKSDKSGKAPGIDALRNFFLGTKVIKAGWINILFIIGQNFVTSLLFFAIASIFEIEYNLLWAIVNLIYSLIMTLILYIPFKVYRNILIEQLVADEIRFIED